jgi:hypothetical protein
VRSGKPSIRYSSLRHVASLKVVDRADGKTPPHFEKWHPFVTGVTEDAEKTSAGTDDAKSPSAQI